MSRDDAAKPSGRIGLVLGAGGPVGHAFHCGVLQGLAAATGWDPRDAAIVLGTSAGAQVAALLRAGMSAADLAARVTGRRMSPAGRAVAQHYVRPNHAEADPSQARQLTPAAPAHLLQTFLRPWRFHPGTMTAAALPPGRVSMATQAAGLRQVFGRRWTPRPLWICALRLETGERVVFGRKGAPRADVGAAVAASGAVPGVCIPVRIGGERYVDGGLVSPTSADILSESSLDLVFVLSPMSTLLPIRLFLRSEVARLRRCGTEVVVLEPTGRLQGVMGWNLMDTQRASAVADAAHSWTLGIARRRDLRSRLQRLSAHRRPADEPTER